MARIADGRSVFELLRRRQNVDRYRRLDQIVHENELPQKRRHLPFFNSEWNVLTDRLMNRLFQEEDG
jgi:hypothetical protein